MKRSNTLSGMMKRRALCSAACLAMIFITSTANAAGWHFSFTPYAWLTDISVEGKLDGRTVVDEEISVGDLIEDLKTTFQGRFELQHGEFSAMVDLFDVTLGDEVAGVALPNGAGSADLSSDIGMTLLDIAATYDRGGNHQGFSFLYGTRLINNRSEIDATFHLTSGSDVSESYDTDEWLADMLVGMSYTKRFSNHFLYQTEADFSVGGTDYTWSLGPSLTYAFGKYGRYGITAGYRRMTINYEEENDFGAQMTMSGAEVSFRASF